MFSGSQQIVKHKLFLLYPYLYLHILDGTALFSGTIPSNFFSKVFSAYQRRTSKLSAAATSQIKSGCVHFWSPVKKNNEPFDENNLFHLRWQLWFNSTACISPCSWMKNTLWNWCCYVLSNHTNYYTFSKLSYYHYDRIDNFSISFLRTHIATHGIQNNGRTGCTVRARIVRNDRELFNQIIYTQ